VKIGNEIIEKVSYSELNARQKESYNFQKVSSILADYGFTTMLLNNDWQGADFIAQNINSDFFLKVQLKGRLTFSKKYIGKDIFIAFPSLIESYQNWYLFPHDDLLSIFLNDFKLGASKSWVEEGLYSFNRLSNKQIELLKQYKL